MENLRSISRLWGILLWRLLGSGRTDKLRINQRQRNVKRRNKKMKKNTVLLSLSLISCLIFTTGAWASSGPTLKNFKGDVQVLKQGSTTWTAVQEGMALGKGDRIKTGEKSKADIVLGQGTITLNEATEFGIKEYSEEGDQIKSTGELALGKLRAKVEKLQAGSTFEIRTPTAVAAVRGTLFDLWV